MKPFNADSTGPTTGADTLGNDTDRAAGASAHVRKVHPLVRIDYPVRIVANLFSGLLLLAALAERPTPTWVWVALAAWVLVWPHLAYQVALRVADSKRAEQRNLALDSLMLGLWSAAVGFNPLVSVLLFVGINTANLSTVGTTGAVRGMAMFLGGALVGGLLFGFDVDLTVSAFTSVLGAIGLVILYLVMKSAAALVAAALSITVAVKISLFVVYMRKGGRFD